MESLDNVLQYSVNELSSYLNSELEGKVNSLYRIVATFDDNKITGSVSISELDTRRAPGTCTPNWRMENSQKHN